MQSAKCEAPQFCNLQCETCILHRGDFMPVLIVVGAQWGDEGKGKIIDLLTERADVVARYQGGHNAGHTVVFSFQSQRKAMPKNDQTTRQLHSSHTLLK